MSDDINNVKNIILSYIEQNKIHELKPYITNINVVKSIVAPILISLIEDILDQVKNELNEYYSELDDDETRETYYNIINWMKRDMSNYLRIIHLITLEYLKLKQYSSRIASVVNKNIISINNKIQDLFEKLKRGDVDPISVYEILQQTLFPIFMYLDSITYGNEPDYTVFLAATSRIKKKTEEKQEEIKDEYLIVGKIISDLYDATNVPVIPQQIRQVSSEYGIDSRLIAPAIKVLKRRNLINGDSKTGYVPTDELRNLLESKGLGTPGIGSENELGGM